MRGGRLPCFEPNRRARQAVGEGMCCRARGRESLPHGPVPHGRSCAQVSHPRLRPTGPRTASLKGGLTGPPLGDAVPLGTLPSPTDTNPSSEHAGVPVTVECKRRTNLEDGDGSESSPPRYGESMKADPREPRTCRVCQKPYWRRMSPGGWKPNWTRFGRRKYCGASCANLGKRTWPPEMVEAMFCHLAQGTTWRETAHLLTVEFGVKATRDTVASRIARFTQALEKEY